MEIKLQIMNDELFPEGGRERDKIILALDRALGGGVWERDGEGWLIRN